MFGHINQKNPITAAMAMIVITVKFNSPVAAFITTSPFYHLFSL
jgi:hypothetical protein